MIDNISYSAESISYRQGTNGQIGIRLKNGANVTDLTGYTARLEVQKDYATRSNDCVIMADITPHPDGNMLVFIFVPSTLAHVFVSNQDGISERVYQIKVIADNGEVSIPMQGTFTLYKDLSP